jgi:sugar lactone lactonase YvrE
MHFKDAFIISGSLRKFIHGDSMSLGPFRPTCLLRQIFGLAVLTASAALHAQATAPAVALATTAIGASTTGTVTFTFTGSTAVASISVVAQGTPSLDFTLNTAAPGTCAAITYTSGTCTVGVTFTPLAAGARTGAVVLRDGSSNVLGVGLLSGIGSGAAFVTPTGTAALVPGGGTLYSQSLFVDAAGNLYMTGSYMERNLKITPAGVVTTITGSAPDPVGAVVDGAGYAYVADTYNEAIFKVDQVTGVTTTFASGFGTLKGLTIDSLGNLYASDGSGGTSGNYVIDQITPAGVVTTVVNTGIPNLALGLAVDSANNVYWAAPNSGYIFKYSPATSSTSQVSTTYLSSPSQLTVDAAGNIYVLAGSGATNIYFIAAGTSAATVLTSPGVGSLSAIALDGAGNLYLGSYSSPYGLYKLDRTHPTASPTGATAVGSHSSESTVTYVNDGNAASAITGSAIAAPAIAGPSTTCTASNAVAVLGTCVVGIEFAPTAHGSPQSGTVTLTGPITSPVYTITGYVAGDPEKLGFGVSPPANITAGGNAGTGTVQVQDNGGTLVTGNTASITLQITGPGSYTFSCTVAAVNGTATFNLANTSTCYTAATLTTSGTYTYAASASGLTGTSTIEAVSPAATTHFTVTPSSTSPNGGAADTITVNAYDTYGNLTTGYTGTVKLTSTDAAAMLPPNFTLSAGTGTASVAFYTAGTQTVTATDTVTSSIAGTSPSITVVAVPVFTVTTAVDDATATAANCNDISVGGTPLGNCSLRDALAAVDAKAFTGATGTQPAIIFSQTALGYTSSNAVTITLTSALSVAHNVNIAGPGANLLSISGNGAYRILAQTGGPTDTTVSGLTLTKGYSSQGGAFYGNVAATNTYNFTNVVVTGNTVPTSATGYGALYVNLGTPTVNITTSTFSNNQDLPGSSVANGGAVYLGTGTLNIANSLFTGNVASSTGTSYGGAIYIKSGVTFTITGSAFVNNIAGSASGTAGIAYGGALYIIMGASNYTGSITNTLFTANMASATSFTEAGAIYYATGTFTLTGSTFLNNSVTTPGGVNGTNNHLGGAIFNVGTLSLYNDTITANSAINPGGTALSGGVHNLGSLYAYNTAVSGNTVTATNATYKDENGFTGTINSYLDASTTSTCTTNCTPLLTALANYGGPVIGAPGGTTATNVAQATGSNYLAYQNIATFTSIPLPGSPLLAAGTTIYVYPTSTRPSTVACNGTATETDPRGCAYPRTLTEAGATHVDIGATEANYALTFVQQPSSGFTGINLNPAPTVQVYESGVAFNATPLAGSGLLTVTAAAGTPTTTNALANSGLDTVTISFPANETADTLTALVQSSAATPITVASVTSNPFSIITDSIWLVDSSGALIKLTESGTPNASTSATSGTGTLGGVAFDAAGNTWSVTSADNALAFYSYANGAASTPYTGGGLSAPVALAVDGAGSIWITNSGNNSLSEFSNAGTAITPTTGYTSGAASDFVTPSALVLDTTGGVWVANKTGNSITHVFGAAAPVITPLVKAVTASALGTKP